MKKPISNINHKKGVNEKKKLKINVNFYIMYKSRNTSPAFENIFQFKTFVKNFVLVKSIAPQLPSLSFPAISYMKIMVSI